MKVLYVTQIGGFLFPSNGGQLRTHHVLSKLCQNHSVDVYCPKLSATRSHGRALKISESRKTSRLGLRGLFFNFHDIEEVGFV